MQAAVFHALIQLYMYQQSHRPRNYIACMRQEKVSFPPSFLYAVLMYVLATANPINQGQHPVAHTLKNIHRGRNSIGGQGKFHFFMWGAAGLRGGRSPSLF